ncbi:MAG: Na+/H+ antiporter subunit D [Planctomycetota bacterium]|nr:MAG: Na+/H+ antiporter subunit D [Planctomycetota bacterium]
MPNEPYIVLLVAIPMATAVLSTLVRGWLSAQRALTVVGLAASSVLSIVWLVTLEPGALMVSQAGDWPAPFGITLVFDRLSGLMLAAAGFVALAVYLFGIASSEQEQGRGWFHPLYALLMMGVNFSFLTGDLFNLFVAFEIMLMASYAMMGLGGDKRQLSQAYKYVMINLVGSTFFVLGAALIYGMTGTLNYADLAVRVLESTTPGGAPLPTGFTAVATMLLFVFAIKAALFPLWFWLPDTYHTCSISVAAVFAGLLTKVGVYALVRLAPMVLAAPNIREAGPIMTILPLAAGLTMLLGGLAALAMRETRRILAMLLISHIGYMAFGLAVMTPAALSGSVFYMIQHMVVMAALFLACGLIEHRLRSSDLAETGGLATRAPWLAALFFIAMFSLVGLPPLSGFFGKFILLREGFRLSGRGYWLLSALGLATGFLTLLALGKVWIRTFWGPAPERAIADRIAPAADRFAALPMHLALALLVAASIGMGLGAEAVQRYTSAATADLNHPRGYVTAVLGPGAWPGEPTVDRAPAILGPPVALTVDASPTETR